MSNLQNCNTQKSISNCADDVNLFENWDRDKLLKYAIAQNQILNQVFENENCVIVGNLKSLAKEWTTFKCTYFTQNSTSDTTLQSTNNHIHENRVYTYLSSPCGGAQLDSPTRHHIETLNIRVEALRSRNANLERALEASQKSLNSRNTRRRLEDVQCRVESQQAGDVDELEKFRNECERLRPLEGRVNSLEEQLQMQQCKIQQLKESCALKTQEAVSVQNECHRINEKLKHVSTINERLEEDIRLLYSQHKQELQRVDELYRHEDYKKRYTNTVFNMIKLRDEMSILLEALMSDQLSDNSHQSLELMSYALKQVESIVQNCRRRTERECSSMRAQYEERLRNVVSTGKCELERANMMNTLCIASLKEHLSYALQESSNHKKDLLEIKNNLINTQKDLIIIKKKLSDKERALLDVKSELQNRVEMCVFMEQESELKLEEMEQERCQQEKTWRAEVESLRAEHEERLERERREWDEQMKRAMSVRDDGRQREAKYALGYMKGVLMVCEHEKRRLVRAADEKWKRTCEDYEERLEECVGKCQSLEEQVERTRVEKELLVDECAQLKSQVSEQRERCEAMKAEYDANATRASEEAASQQHAKSLEYAEMFSEHDGWLRDMKHAVISLSEQLRDTLAYHRLEYEQEISHLRSVISEKLSQIDDLETEALTNKEDLRRTNHTLQQCRLRLSQLESKDSSSLEGIDVLAVKRQNDILLLQVRQTDERIASIFRENEMLRARIVELDESYKHQLKVSSNTQKRHEKKLNQAEQERISLLLFMASLREKLVTQCQQHPVIKEILSACFQTSHLKPPLEQADEASR